MQAESRSEGGKKPTARSRITNGNAILPGVDGRSTWIRRLRDLMLLHIEDLGGEDTISEAQRSLIRRVSTLEVELERMEAEFANEGAADPKALDLYQRTTGNLRRVLETLGIERKAKDVTPDVRGYLSQTAATKAEAA